MVFEMKDKFGREWEMVRLTDKKNNLIKLVNRLTSFIRKKWSGK
jgi:hypothetical protein